MADTTHDWGRSYWHVVRVPWRTPPVQLHGISHEVEEPWRIGRCVLLRLPGPWCLVLGRWGSGRTAEQMLADERDSFDVRHKADVVEIREHFLSQRRAV